MLVTARMKKATPPRLRNPLHPPRGETAQFCRLHRSDVEIGGPYLGLARIGPAFSQNDRQAVGLFSGRAARGPDQQTSAIAPRSQEELRNDAARERAKLGAVAKKIGLTHRYQRKQRAELVLSRKLPKASDVLRGIRQTERRHSLTQRKPQPGVAVGTNLETGALVEKRCQLTECFGSNAQQVSANWINAGAILSSGRICSAAPISTASLGMPNTTHEARS